MSGVLAAIERAALRAAAFVPEHRRKAHLPYIGYLPLNNMRFPAVLGNKHRPKARFRWQPELFAVFVVLAVYSFYHMLNRCHTSVFLVRYSVFDICKWLRGSALNNLMA